MPGRRNRWVVGLVLVALPQAGCLGVKGALAPEPPPLTGPSAAAEPKPEKALPPEKSAELCLSIGDTMRQSGHLAEAVVQYEQARQYNPKLTAATHRLALVRDELGEHAAALAEFQRALKEKPHDPDLLNDYGYSHYCERNWAEAEAQFRAALRAAPKHERAWVNLGMALGQQGRAEESLAAFAKVVPPAAAHCNLGYIFLTQGKKEEAREQYLQALEIDGACPMAQAVLARLDKPGPKPADGSGVVPTTATAPAPAGQ
jgi:Tfp pilus assembly protein PilF